MRTALRWRSDVADLRPIDLTSSGVASWSLNLVVTLAFMTVLFLAEEIGWRGYLLPRIQQLTSRRRAALVTGFIHGCFHLPLILIATTYDEHGSRWLVAPVVVATITMGGVFYAYVWDRTHSVWPVAMAHGAVNTAFAIGAAAVVARSEPTWPTSPARAASPPSRRWPWSGRSSWLAPGCGGPNRPRWRCASASWPGPPRSGDSR